MNVRQARTGRLPPRQRPSILEGRLPPRITATEASDLRSCPAHRAWVRKHYCSVPGCRALPIECAHVRRNTDDGMALKPSDRWSISLCSGRHAEQHCLGEKRFEIKYDLDGHSLATEFFKKISAARQAGSAKLGSGLVDQSQKMTVAARAMAERKTVGHRS